MRRATERIDRSASDDDGTLTIEMRAEAVRGRELDTRLAVLLDALESGSHPCAESARELERLVLENYDRNDRLQRLAVGAEAYLADTFMREQWEQFIREEAYEKGRRDEREAQEEARQNVPPQRKGGGHAKRDAKRDAKRAAWTVLPGGLAAFAAAAVEVTRHAGHGKAGAAVAAHKAVAVKLAAVAAITVPAVTLGSMALLPNSGPVPRGRVPSAASPAPAASARAPRPITAPGQRQLIAAITGGVTHQSLAPALTVGLAQPLDGVEASQPDPGPSSVSWGSSAPSQPEAQGQLSLDTTALDLSGGTSQAKIRLTATGGPVSWQAANVPSDIRLSFSSGKIWAGVTVTITVSRAAVQDGLPQVAFMIDDTPVTVSLPVPAPQPSPSSSPSPAGTTAPSDLPSALPASTAS